MEYGFWTCMLTLISVFKLYCISGTPVIKFEQGKSSVVKEYTKGCTGESLILHQPLIIFSEQKDRLMTGNEALDGELLQALALLDTCHLVEGIEVFNEILKDHPRCFGALIGRGASESRKMLQGKTSDTEAAMRDLGEALNLQPENSIAWQARAEANMLLGKMNNAFSDIKKAIDLTKNAHSYALAGVIAHQAEQFSQSVAYMKNAMKYETGHRPIVHQYLGEAYLGLGMLRDAISSLQDCLEIEPENTHVMKALGSAFNDLGDENSAIHMLSEALKVDNHDVKALMLRGHVYFASGQIHKALDDYKLCTQYDASEYSCHFMRALSHASVGQFFDGVKSATKVMLGTMGTSFLPEFSQAFFIREFARYLHARLDTSMTEFRFEDELPENLSEIWIKSLPLSLSNYTEQEGIKPHITDADQLSFKELPDDAQFLLCRTLEISTLMQYHTDGFMPNYRSNRAMSLAVIDVAQTVRRYWKSPKTVRGWHGKRFCWRDVFDTAVRWRKVVSMGYPVVWLDQFPKKIRDTGFTKHFMVKKGHVQIPRYDAYLPEALDLAKFMIKSILSQKLPTKMQDNLIKAPAVKDVMQIVKKYATDSKSGFTVGMQVPGSRKSSPALDGVHITLSGDSEDDDSLIISSVMSQVRTNQYHSELEFLWSRITEEANKKNRKDDMNHLILSFIYYFYNFFPLSKGSSAVSYAVCLGLFLAVGKEVTGPVPIGKQPDLEAFFAGSPELFVRRVEPWLGIQKSSIDIEAMPSVHLAFPTLRAMLELLNVDLKEKQCSKMYKKWNNKR